jgi:YbgC/YbaW family acyl-CoA thioester hydrolase
MTQPDYSIEVTFGECDPAGIVFYPNYFRWFDAAFGRMLRSAGVEASDRRRFPLLEAAIGFAAPAAEGDGLAVRSRVSELNPKTVRVHHRVMRGDVLIAEGSELRVWVDPQPDGSIKAAPVPSQIRAVLHHLKSTPDAAVQQKATAQ